jgi:hypothetical protein
MTISSSMNPESTLAFENLVSRDANGVVGLSSALLCTLYLRKDFEPARRQAIKDFVLRFVDATKGELRWLMPTKNGARSITPGSIGKELDAKLEALSDSEDPWELHIHGGEQAEAASDIGLEISLRRRWEAEPPHNHLAFISFRFPVLWFRDKKPGFPSFVLSASELLQPVHGYAGIGLVNAADRFLAAQFDNVVVGLAERFPGLEIDYPAKHLMWLRAGIKGVNWLTVLGDDVIARMGGIDGVRAALPSTATVHTFRGGCLIQAGLIPQIGDRNRQLGVEEYRTVAVALKPIRITTHSAVHGADGMDRARFENWLARFD